MPECPARSWSRVSWDYEQRWDRHADAAVPGGYAISGDAGAFEEIMDPLRLRLPRTAKNDADVEAIAAALGRLVNPVADFPCPTQPYTIVQPARSVRALRHQGIVWDYQTWRYGETGPIVGLYLVSTWGWPVLMPFSLKLPRAREYDAVVQAIVDALRRIAAREGPPIAEG